MSDPTRRSRPCDPSDPGGRTAFPPDAYRGRVPPLAPHGAACRAFHEGRAADLRLRSSLGEDEPFPVDFFFRDADGMLPFERYALELARGAVVDLGSGTGPHALELQRRGLEVLSVEISAELVRLQRERGVRRALHADFRLWSSGGFDTVLLLMNGLGPTGTLAGLDRFLAHAAGFLAPGGELLVDAAEAVPAAGREGGAGKADEHGGEPDVAGDEPDDGVDGRKWPPAGEYAGQAWIELEHAGRVGRPFRELYVDLDTLGRHAEAAGWRFGIAFEDGTGAYLARLTRG